ncbi:MULTISPECIES: OB-fold nucleic acid binding domain-containing protein [unclassified Janibacter]|uniref:OB-fold nucleic acid binding domain-containing protein n=1 Tax=unclassified Janibacter TaxID=2649294 RepID=UPI003D09324A
MDRLGALLSHSDDDLEDAELSESSDRTGGQTIDEAADRSLVVAAGVVRSVTLRPKENVPALLVEMYDGRTAVNLVWLGRRSIRGIHPGIYLRVNGRVTWLRGQPTIFNPAYEILPDRGAGSEAPHES